MTLPVDTHTCPNVHEIRCRERASDHHTGNNTDQEHKTQKNSDKQNPSGNLGRHLPKVRL